VESWSGKGTTVPVAGEGAEPSALAAFHASRSLDHQPFRSACYAPFVGLSFDAHGTVSVCAFTRATPLGRVGEQRLIEMWTGTAISKLREAVRRDDLAGSCFRCAEEIAGGNLHGVLATGFDRFTAEPVAPWPTRMEFALSNACNLQCVMCSGEFSSAIRSQREGLLPLPGRYGESFLNELGPFIPHLEQARFLGGEPFLAPLNFRIWELMIDLGADVECNVTTNGTQWNDRIEAVLEQLRFSVGISIDGVSRETVEKVRAGASFDRIMANLDRFIAYRDRRGTSLSLTFCLMVDNWHEFADFLRFAEDRGCQVYVNTVRQPPAHSLYHLPAEELHEVVRRLGADRDQVAGQLTLNRSVWLEQLDRLVHHLEGRQAGEIAEPPGPDRGWRPLVAALGEPDAAEEEVLEMLRSVALGGRVWIVRSSRADLLVEGDRYAGISIDHLLGSPSHHLYSVLGDAFGHHSEVLAERVSKGSIARVLSFRRVGSEPTVIATITLRGPDPFGSTRISAVLASSPSASAAVAVDLRPGARRCS
jgi:MoaA/NifB/PqqE/SkfB family radical SAM enzyme